jgi:DNA-binding CsgD family transcriptional regulator
MTQEQLPPPTVLRNQSSQREAVGLILLDVEMKALYMSSAARDVLLNGQSTQTSALQEDQLSRKIQSLLIPGAGNGNPPPTLMSGRRRYLCRILPLGPAGAGPQIPHSAILLQRISRRNEHVRRLVEVFKLTPRECQTLQLVAEGLTSKEIATKMDISPHTVRAFLNFIMVKLDVTTRSGIVGRVNAMFTPWERNF